MAEYRTDITVYGSKENIIRMLNAAIRNVGNGTISLIEEGDDAITINNKLRVPKEIGWMRLHINVSDLLDDNYLNDSQLQAKKEAFFREHNGDGWSESLLEKPIGIEWLSIKKTGYVVYFEVCRGGYADWLDWDEIARLYECSICIDKFDKFEDMCIPDRNHINSFRGTTIFEYKNGSVEKTSIMPRIGFDLNRTEFDAEFEKLIQFDPIKYRGKKIHQYEEIIEFIKDYIIGEEEYQRDLALGWINQETEHDYDDLPF